MSLRRPPRPHPSHCSQRRTLSRVSNSPGARNRVHTKVIRGSTHPGMVELSISVDGNADSLRPPCVEGIKIRTGAGKFISFFFSGATSAQTHLLCLRYMHRRDRVSPRASSTTNEEETRIQKSSTFGQRPGVAKSISRVEQGDDVNDLNLQHCKTLIK